MTEARELRGVGRYEWEQIVLRARWTGVVPAAGKRGAVSGATFRAVALAWASHADGVTGCDMFPGDAVLAVEAETSIKTVKAVKAALIALGMVDRVRAGARRSHGADEYRLTLPSDLLDVLEVLTPAAVKTAAIRLGDDYRGKRGGTGGPPTNPDVGVPVDPPQPESAESRGGSGGPAPDGCGGSTGPVVGGPVDRYTNQTTQRSTTIQTVADVDLESAGPRANGRKPTEILKCVTPGCAKGFVLSADGTTIERCPDPSHPPPDNVIPFPVRQTA